MPITRRQVTAAGTGYNSPFVGPAEHPVMVPVLVSGLTSAEVDASGFIKPGVLLRADGTLVSAAAQIAFGVTPEAVRIANSNSGSDLTAAGTVDVTVMVIAVVNKHLGEANLGRAYTANEIAACLAAGSSVKLVG